jgi:hypothetical protein
MSTYVDTLAKCKPGPGWRHTSSCHLIADSTNELIVFAHRIHCKVGWLKASRKGVHHFDLAPKLRELAVQNGAEEISRRQLAKMLRGTSA